MKKNGKDFREKTGAFGLITAETLSEIIASLDTIVVVLCPTSHYNLNQCLFN
jgi:hypothetical protein